MPRHNTPLEALQALVVSHREVSAINRQIRRLRAERDRHDATIDAISTDIDELNTEIPNGLMLVAVDGYTVRLDADHRGNVDISLLPGDYKPQTVVTTHEVLESWPELAKEDVA